MIDFFEQKVTVYSNIQGDAVSDRRIDRFVVGCCNVQSGIVSKADGTVENIVNAVTVIIKDVDNYVSPSEYKNTPVDIRQGLFTVQVGDFVVLDEVDDVVVTSRDSGELQEKYKDNGIVVRSVSANIHGMSIDNVTITNVG